MLKYVFLVAAVSVVVCAHAAQADLASDLIAHYTFNDHAMDISGNANHGSIVGGVVTATDRYGNQTGCYEFNGVNSYVHVPYSVSLSSPDTAVTQAAWVYLNGTSLVGQAFGPVIMKSTSGANAFMYRMTAQPVGFGVAFNNWYNQANADEPLDLYRWYHVVAVFDVSEVRFFLDGAPVDTVAMAITMNQDMRDLTIGADIPGILEIFNGRIDDVRLYSRALSNAEVAELYAQDAVAIEESPSLAGLSLSPGYPNPSSTRTRLHFTLPIAQSVRLSVIDVTGRRVRHLESGSYPAGRHAAVWDGRDDLGRSVPAGLYFLQLQAGHQVRTTRIARLP
jgi:hypothetical protein